MANAGFSSVVHNPDFDLRQVATDRLHTAADSPERTLAAVRSTFRGAANVELLSARVGVRPMPADGEPIVGPVAEVPGLYRSPSCASKPVAPVRSACESAGDHTASPRLAGSLAVRVPTS